MVRRRVVLATSLAVVLAISGYSPRSQADEFGDAAQKFVESLSDQAIAALTNKNVPRDIRVDRFRVLLNDHFAVKTIARWVLGRYWRTATNDERDEYFQLFENLVVAIYVDRFANYAGVTLTVTKSDVKGDQDVIVHSKIVLPDNVDPLNVAWRVRARAGEHKIIDVIVEGVSMAQTQRSEFASVIRQNGGKVEGLLAELRKRTKGNA
jgi:phospholipid transport system substrate-binding protein